jgi:hypothetical protein
MPSPATKLDDQRPFAGREGETVDECDDVKVETSAKDEIDAIAAVLDALEPLDEKARHRTLAYAVARTMRVDFDAAMSLLAVKPRRGGRRG